MQEETGYHYSKHLLRGYPTNRPKKKAGLTLVIRNEKKKIIQHYPEDATRCSCGGTGAAWLAPPGAPGRVPVSGLLTLPFNAVR
jgi:hypothetical protein